jgi:hypothetical protein
MPKLAHIARFPHTCSFGTEGSVMASELPPDVRAEVERILSSAARRLLEQQAAATPDTDQRAA